MIFMKTITTMELALLFDYDFKQFNSMVAQAFKFSDDMAMHSEDFEHELFGEYYVLNRQAVIAFFKYLAEDSIVTGKERQISGHRLKQMMEVLSIME